MKKVSLIFNVIITLLVLTGICFSLFIHDGEAMLLTEGLSNFKYYTVLSNVFAGIVAMLMLLMRGGAGNEKKSRFLTVLRLTAAAMVSITFLTIALFLGPLYGYSKMYRNANFFFHLVVPLLSVADYLFIEDNARISKKAALPAAGLTFLYGLGYLVNIWINGIGEWPDTNDWYGFLNWGYPVGMLIFACITLFALLLALLLRFLAVKIRPDKGKETDHGRDH